MMERSHGVDRLIRHDGIIGPAAKFLRGEHCTCGSSSDCAGSLAQVFLDAARDCEQYFNGYDEEGLAVLLVLACIAAGPQPAVSRHLRSAQAMCCPLAMPDVEELHAALRVLLERIGRGECGWAAELGVDRPDDGRHYMIQLRTSHGSRTWLHPSMLRDSEFSSVACNPGAFRKLAGAVMKCRVGQPQSVRFPTMERLGLLLDGSLRQWSDLYNAFTALLECAPSCCSSCITDGSSAGIPAAVSAA